MCAMEIAQSQDKLVRIMIWQLLKVDGRDVTASNGIGLLLNDREILMIFS